MTYHKLYFLYVFSFFACIGPVLYAQTPIPAHQIGSYPDGKIKFEGERENLVDEDGVQDIKVGKWKYYFPDGQVYAEGEYSDGGKTGPWTWYYIGGKTKTKAFFSRESQSVTADSWYETGEKEFSGTFLLDFDDYLYNFREDNVYLINGTSWFKNGKKRSEETCQFFPPKPDEDHPLYLENFKIYWPNGKIAIDHMEENPESDGSLGGAIPALGGFYFPDGEQILTASFGHEYWQSGENGAHWPANDENVSLVGISRFDKRKNTLPYRPFGKGLDGGVSLCSYNSNFLSNDPGRDLDLMTPQKSKTLSVPIVESGFKNGFCSGGWVVYLFDKCELTFDETGLLKKVVRNGQWGQDVYEFENGFLAEKGFGPSEKHHIKKAKDK